MIKDHLPWRRCAFGALTIFDLRRITAEKIEAQKIDNTSKIPTWTSQNQKEKLAHKN